MLSHAVGPGGALDEGGVVLRSGLQGGVMVTAKRRER